MPRPNFGNIHNHSQLAFSTFKSDFYFYLLLFLSSGWVSCPIFKADGPLMQNSLMKYATIVQFPLAVFSSCNSSPSQVMEPGGVMLTDMGGGATCTLEEC